MNISPSSKDILYNLNSKTSRIFRQQSEPIRADHTQRSSSHVLNILSHQEFLTVVQKFRLNSSKIQQQLSSIKKP